MTIQELTDIANNFTDETLDIDMTLGFANTGIGKINGMLRTKLPLFPSEDTAVDYEALPDYWQHALFVPYIAWGIKMNDGSVVEAREYLNEFNQALYMLKKEKKSVIDKIYWGDNFSGVVQIKQFPGRWGK